MQKQEAAAAAGGVMRVSSSVEQRKKGGRGLVDDHALGGGSNSASRRPQIERKSRKSGGAGECRRTAARANDIQTYVVKEATTLVSPTCILPYEPSPQPTRACKTGTQETPAAPDLHKSSAASNIQAKGKEAVRARQERATQAKHVAFVFALKHSVTLQTLLGSK